MSNPTENHERVFKGVWIEQEIWDHPDLSLFEMALWGNIWSLSSHNRPCTASNEWLAKRMRCTENHISDSIAHLKSLGLIVIGKYDGRCRRMTTASARTQSPENSEQDTENSVVRVRKIPPSEAVPILQEGTSKSKAKDITAKAGGKMGKEDSSRFVEFKKIWFEEFKETFRTDYVPSGQDFNHLKTFLESNDAHPFELIATAKQAWTARGNSKNWKCCKHTGSISAFVLHYPEIVDELRGSLPKPIDYSHGAGLDKYKK